MNFCKNYLSCWCVFAAFSTWREYEYFSISKLFFFKSLSLFIENLRDVENCQHINLSWLKLWFSTDDLLPDLIVVLRRNKFKSIPKWKGTMSANIVVIFVLYRRQYAEMVVAEVCADLVVVQFVLVLCQRSLASGEVASDNLASRELASDDVIFRSAFFRRTRLSSGMLSIRCSSSFNKIPLLFNLFNQNLYE